MLVPRRVLFQGVGDANWGLEDDFPFQLGDLFKFQPLTSQSLLDWGFPISSPDISSIIPNCLRDTTKRSCFIGITKNNTKTEGNLELPWALNQSKNMVFFTSGNHDMISKPSNPRDSTPKAISSLTKARLVSGCIRSSWGTATGRNCRGKFCAEIEWLRFSPSKRNVVQTHMGVS